MKPFRLLLRAYPREFRERHGAEMERTFERLLELCGAQGNGGRARVWLIGSVDVIRGGLAERWRSRESWHWRKLMMGWTSDVRFALRTLVRQPVFTLAAVATLALAVGANAAIFSVVYSLLFRPLPYPDGDALVLVWSQNAARGWTRTDVSLADAWDWRNRTTVFQDLAVVGRSSPNLTGLDRPERLEARIATWNLLSVFGIAPLLGRTFTEADGAPSAPGTVVLTHAFWQRRFGGEAGVLGREVVLDGEPYTVIGVMGPEFRLPDVQADVILPFRLDPATASRDNHSHVAIARLASGAGIERARREVESVAVALESEYPSSNAGWSAHVVSLRSDLLGDMGQRAAVVLWAAVAFVLLMACVNVANLLLARGSARRREVAMRTALGAGRARIVRQLLTESLLLAVLGGAFGLVLAVGGLRAIVAALPARLSPAFRFTMDGPVLVFGLAMIVLATFAFGLWPALRASSVSAGALREEGRAGIARHARRFGGALVVTQTALAVVLLVGGGLMMRSLVRMQRQDLGFDPSNVLTARISPPAAKYAGGDELTVFYDVLIDRLRALPGVRQAGIIHNLPLAGSNTVNSYRVVGAHDSPDQGYPARFGYVSHSYFEAMGIRVVRGRGIAPSDHAGAEPVGLINETLARRAFGSEDPIGRMLELDGETFTVIGIAPDMRERGLERAPEPSIYLPVAQHPTRSRAIVLRTSGAPASFAAAVQREVLALDPDLPIYDVRTMNEVLAERAGPFALIAGLMLCFALIALVLGAVGIYGVTAYGVGRRTGEIGLRIAIGARREAVVRMIVGEGMRRAAIGLLLGLAGAFALGRAMAGLLVDVSPTDPPTFIAVVALLLAVAVLGAWLPARRIARLDPLRSLNST